MRKGRSRLALSDRVSQPLRRQDQRAAIVSAEGAYPVGSFFFSALSTNPAEQLGFGTWVPVVGRVLVGLDASQVEFDTVLEIGGEKLHVLVPAEVP